MIPCSLHIVQGLFLKLWSKGSEIFLLFSLYFSSFNRIISQFDKNGLIGFANKLYHIQYMHTCRFYRSTKIHISLLFSDCWGQVPGHQICRKPKWWQNWTQREYYSRLTFMMSESSAQRLSVQCWSSYPFPCTVSSNAHSAGTRTRPRVRGGSSHFQIACLPVEPTLPYPVVPSKNPPICSIIYFIFQGCIFLGFKSANIFVECTIKCSKFLSQCIAVLEVFGST